MTRAATATVLTVEDDPIVRADLRLVLEDAGFEVCADARDGVEAVTLAREHRPDLILVDLSLPHLDGVEAATRIREERAVPFVALTGHREGDLIDRAVAAGAAGVVLKPFHERAVVRAVRDALDEAGRDPAAARRSESRRAIAELLELLGQPVGWADELEARAFAQGRVWRRAR